MATHDYVIANGTGAAVRSDLNDALAAIVSNNSGSSEPATTYAYQWWADTTNNVLKIRNSANNAWITLRELDGTMLIEDGSAASPGLAFADDTDTGIFSPGSDNIAFATGGGERLRIDSNEAVFNEDSNDYNFRVESNGQTHALFVDGSEDAVGIGTSTPGNFKQGAQNLVVGTGSGAEGMTIYSQSNASGRICFADGDGAGDEERGQILYAHDDNSMQFSTNANERARLDSSGRFLVGKSSVDLTSSKLEVTGASNANFLSILNESASDADGNRYSKLFFRGTQSGGETSTLCSVQSAHDGSADDQKGRLTFHTNDGSDNDGPTERVRVDSTGNIGIGVTSPQGTLHVGRTGGNAKLLLHRTNAAGNTDDYGSVIWRSNNNNNNGAIGVARQSAENDGYMFFSTASSGTLSERMRIFSGGGVGVSTSNQIASAPLTVGGTNGVQVRSTGVDGTFAETFGSFYSGNNNERNIIKTSVSSAGDNSGFLFEASDGGGAATTTDVYRMCRTVHKAFIGGNEVYQITNNKVIAINEASPGTTHHVEVAYSPNTRGCVYLENFAYYSGQPALTIHDQDNNSARNMEDVQFKRNGSLVGYIRISTGSVTYSTSSSDRRAKKNFEDWTEDNLVKFKTLSPQLFNWIEEEDGAEKTKGFIAQDNLEKFPEAYPLTASTDRYSFNPSGMVAYMMKALQEAALKIETLEAKVAALEAG